MAILNGMYIHVVDESVDNQVNTTKHPVEEGIGVTDMVRLTPFTISLSGKLVDYEGMKSYEVLAKLKSLMASGSLISYRGRNVADNMQIQSLNTKHLNTVHGGADFEMELQQVRIAKSSYVPKKEAQTKAKEEAKKNVDASSIKVGSTVVFKGGSVYVSSDASKPAATRNRSTCKVTSINTKSWAVHQYHLESTDGQKVYGWVDLANIEGTTQTSTSGKTNAGTQQTKKTSTTASSGVTDKVGGARKSYTMKQLEA